MSRFTCHAILVCWALLCSYGHAAAPPSLGGAPVAPSSLADHMVPLPGAKPEVPRGLVPLPGALRLGWPPPHGGPVPQNHAAGYDADLPWDDGEILPTPADQDAVEFDVRPVSYWFDDVRVGYDHGFVIASQREVDLEAAHFPFRLQINGWGQIRHVILASDGPNPDLNQFQLKRARLIFAGSAFTSDFSYSIQLDGRSSSGDDMRLLDYLLTYDLGHHLWGFERGAIGFKTGKYKMPFSLARELSGREFEFTDRSMASMYFDVNRSLAWGLYGRTGGGRMPLHWETAIFNGLVTGGAETGSSGSLDNNFAYSARIFAFPIGAWGDADLADLSYHVHPAMRCGSAFAFTTLDKNGTTEFGQIRVVDSGATLASILPRRVDAYRVALYAVDAGWKFRGLSVTTEYYLRYVDDFRGAAIPGLFDHGLWLQLGYFIIPAKLELLARWSRVAGNSGTLGITDQSSDEVAGGLVWYFNGQHAKITADVTHLDGAPINSSSLDIAPGDIGWLFRSQIQFSF
jgi:hypothetical protein